MHYYNTFKRQIELLPRITIIYGDSLNEDDDFGVTHNGIAIEWLWFGIFIKTH